MRDQMKRMGADDDYKRAYFRQCIGHCEETRGSSCVRHRHAPRKLPAGLFCAVEKKECLRELRLRLQFVDSKMQAYKQQWDDVGFPPDSIAQGWAGQFVDAETLCGELLEASDKHGLWALLETGSRQ